jgi:hypothetical protein
MPRPRPNGWSTELAQPMQIRGGKTLTTLADARAYVLSLPESFQRRNQWQHAATLLMAAAEDRTTDAVEAATRQMQLALFLDARLDVAANHPPRRKESAASPCERLAPVIKKKPPASPVRRAPGKETPRRAGDGAK